MPRRFPPSANEERAKTSTDPVELSGLASSRSSFVKSEVARNLHTSPETLRALAHPDDKFVRSRLAWNPNTPVDVLTRLAKSSDEWTQRALAANPSTPPPLLVRLARSTDAETRQKVGENPHTAPATLTLLSGDQDYSVRASVARNPHTPEAALVFLCDDAMDPVAHALSRRNSHLNTRTRQVVTTRFNGVRSQSETIEIPIEEGGRFSTDLIWAFVRSSNDRLHKMAATQPDAPVEALGALARHPDVWVRVRLAQNPTTPDELLVVLAEQGSSEVMVALAERTNVPDSVLGLVATSRVATAHERLPEDAGVRLLSSADPLVRAAAAKVLGTGAEGLWEQMILDGDAKVRAAAAKVMPVRLLDQYVGHACKSVRQEVAARCTDPDVLRTLSGDAQAVVRRRVARNVACPQDVLGVLAADRDVRVRQYAGERFLAALSGGLT